MSSRTFVALVQPISLARGSITTRPFKINLRNDYQVELDTGWENYFDPNCLPSHPGRLRWRPYKDGAPLTDWIDSNPDDSPYFYPYLGGFSSEYGTYEIHLEILSDTACLNPGHPKLLVYTSRYEYEDWASPLLWTSGFGLAFGLSLATLALLTRQSNRHDTRISDSSSIRQHFQWAQKLPLKPQIPSLPAFALLATPVLMIAMFALWVLMTPYPSRGLYVHLLKDEAPGNDEPLGGPVIVSVVGAGAGKTPKVYVNSVLTSWDKLEGALRDQLKIRPKWVVYVEADPNVAWGDAVSAMDIATRLHARVVMLSSDQSSRFRTKATRQSHQ